MKKLLVVMMSLVLILTLISCGSSNESKSMNNFATDADTADYNYAVEATEEEADIGGINYGKSENVVSTTSDRVQPQAERKIIKSASMEIQTLEYDLAVQRLSDKIIGVGGYIESSNVRGKDREEDYSNRSAHFTLRIPQKQFEQFMSDMTNIGTVIQSNTYGEDVTTQIFDHEAHKKTLEIQEERLLDILRKAEKIEDIITLERELSNIRYQIEGLSGTLKRLENLVSYSTLSVSIYEVHEIIEKVEKPKTLGERISARFKESLDRMSDFFEGLAVWTLGSLPLLIIYLPILLILYLIARKVYRKFFYLEEIKTEEEKK